jgi:hypothetical protein
MISSKIKLKEIIKESDKIITKSGKTIINIGKDTLRVKNGVWWVEYYESFYVRGFRFF